MDTVIFAAGKGTRLLPYTEKTPKPLLEIKHSKKIIDYIVDALPEEIDRIIIVVDHLKEQVRNHFSEKYAHRKIIFAEQGETKGTYGALLAAKPYIVSDRFLVLSGDDVVIQSDLKKLISEKQAMGVCKKIMPAYYAIETDEAGYFSRFRSQTDEEKKEGTRIATGSYVLHKGIFDLQPVKIGESEYGLPQMFTGNQSLFPIRVVDIESWLQVNTPADFESLKQSQI